MCRQLDLKIQPGQLLNEFLVVGDDDQLEVSVLGLARGNVGQRHGEAFDIFPDKTVLF